MLLRGLLLACLGLVLTEVAAQDKRTPVQWELNADGGVDLRPGYTIPAEGNALFRGGDDISPDNPAGYGGISAMRRIPGLRALYGLRIEGHAGKLIRSESPFEVSHKTASALVNYRAFVFDMQGDCDCPTWGNDPWFKKAFFVEFGLGVGFRELFDLNPNIDISAQQMFGAAYMARLGLSHRFSKALDVYLAGGLHGLVSGDDAYRANDYALRPALGLTFRP